MLSRIASGKAAPVVGSDLFAFMAADTRVLPTLITLPEVKSYTGLRGRTLTVDATTTGYAFVLRAMLEHGGLRAGEYDIKSIGGVQQRYDDLLDKRHAGCLLNSPLEGLLVAQGFTALDTAANVVGRYQGQVGAARRSWAQAHPDLSADSLAHSCTRWPGSTTSATVKRPMRSFAPTSPAPMSAQRRPRTGCCSIPGTACPPMGASMRKRYARPRVARAVWRAEQSTWFAARLLC